MEKEAAIVKTSWLLEIAKQLFTYSSILAALGYLFGRSYFSGYFNVLGINVSFIQLPFFDYLEIGWLYLWATGLFWGLFASYCIAALIVYSLFVPMLDVLVEKNRKLFIGLAVMILLISFVLLLWNGVVAFIQSLNLVGWIIIGLLVLLAFIFRRKIGIGFSAWGRLLSSKPEYMQRIDDLFEMNNRLVPLILLFLIFLEAFYFFAKQAEDAGGKKAEAYLNKEASVVELVTSNPDLWANASIGELIFLYFNNNYYFFSTLDSSCKPEEVFVVNEKSIISMSMRSRPLATTCSIK